MMIRTLQLSSLILLVAVAPFQSLAFLSPSFTGLRPNLKQSIRSCPTRGIKSVLQASKIPKPNNNDDDDDDDNADDNKKKNKGAKNGSPVRLPKK
jgi:hypothetical protein